MLGRVVFQPGPFDTHSAPMLKFFEKNFTRLKANVKLANCHAAVFPAWYPTYEYNAPTPTHFQASKWVPILADAEADEAANLAALAVARRADEEDRARAERLINGMNDASCVPDAAKWVGMRPILADAEAARRADEEDRARVEMAGPPMTITISAD